MIFEFGAHSFMELCHFYASIIGYIVGFSNKITDLEQSYGMVQQFQASTLLLV